MNSQEAHFDGDYDRLGMDTPRGHSQRAPQQGVDRDRGHAIWICALMVLCWVLLASGALSPKRPSSLAYMSGYCLTGTVFIWAAFCAVFFPKRAPRRRFAAFAAIYGSLLMSPFIRASEEAQEARDVIISPVEQTVASHDADRSTGQIPQEECLAFARALERAIQSGDVEAANQYVDWDAIADATTAGLGAPPEARAEFGRGFVDTVRSVEKGLFARVSGEVAAGGSYRFLRVREVDGYPTVLFRLVSGEGLNYQEFLLHRQAGNLKAVDLWIFASGERVSTTLRRMATPMAKQWSKPLLLRLITPVPEYVTLLAAMREERHGEALDIYAGMPEALRRDKAVLLLRHEAASHVGERELLQAIDDFRQYYPEDVCLDFVLIDYYTLRGEYDGALASIDRMDASVGGDPFLNTNRADIHYAKGEVARALRLAEKAVADCPDLLDAHKTLLGLALLENDHERTLIALTRMEEQFKLDLSGVDRSPELAAFMQSPQGEKWARSHWQSTAAVNQ